MQFQCTPFNPLYTDFHFSRNPEVIDTLYDLYFHFCHELALETLAKCSSIKPVRVHDLCHTHSLVSLQCSGLSDQWMLLPTENCLQWQKWSSYKGGGPFLCQTSGNQGFPIASQGSCHVHGTPCWNPPTSPFPTFFASVKPSFKTDCANW